MSHLVVTLCDGREEHLEAGGDGEKELRNFLDRKGVYGGEWIKLSDLEFVRYDEIVRVKLSL